MRQEAKEYFSLTEKLAKMFPRLAKKIEESRTIGNIGNFLYYVGFWFEYALLRFGRRAKQNLQDIYAAVFALVLKLVHMLANRAAEVVQDVVAPFEYIYTHWSLTREVVHWHFRIIGPRSAWNQLVSRAKAGYPRLKELIYRAGLYLMPLTALSVFVFTVQKVINYDYILAVSIDNNVVGYVQNEAIFDAAKSDVQQRVDKANALTEDADRKISVQPIYSLAVEGDLLDENEMADTILAASSSEIQEASALYVDDDLVAITTEGDELRQVLEDLKAPYEEDDPNTRVEFVKDVEVVDGIYFTDSFSDYDSVRRLVTGEEEAKVTYVVKKGDTPWSIAYDNELDNLETLYSMNPQMNESDYYIHEGDELVIGREQQYLPVKIIRKETYQVTVPFKTKSVESEDYDWGVTKLVTEGRDGLVEYVADVTYIDGVETERDIIDETTLIETIDEEIIKGTRLKDGSVAATATGTIMWPVPNYKYVSRWMSSSHKGSDICAASGAAILAADSGVVTAAGWNAAGSGYGNSLVINHGNGMTTLYAHASALYVSPGQYVSQGQLIAAVGSTGWSSGNHLHFEIRINGALTSAHNYFPGM